MKYFRGVLVGYSALQCSFTSLLRGMGPHLSAVTIDCIRYMFEAGYGCQCLILCLYHVQQHRECNDISRADSFTFITALCLSRVFECLTVSHIDAIN